MTANNYCSGSLAEVTIDRSNAGFVREFVEGLPNGLVVDVAPPMIGCPDCGRNVRTQRKVRFLNSETMVVIVGKHRIKSGEQNLGLVAQVADARKAFDESRQDLERSMIDAHRNECSLRQIAVAAQMSPESVRKIVGS